MPGLSINSYWWRPRGFKNFGDELSAEILKKMGYKVKRVALKKADIIMGGTILDNADKQAKDGCIIWGSGVGWVHDIENRFDVRAVRGGFTAHSLKVNVPLGDPGLLASRLWPKSITQYDVGVVRHYIDKNDYSWADIVIEATEPVEDVIKKISACKVICSSSLHGLIVAQSYGIPAMRITHGEVISGDIKWVDYQSALIKPINEIQDQLLKAIGDL